MNSSKNLLFSFPTTSTFHASKYSFKHLLLLFTGKLSDWQLTTTILHNLFFIEPFCFPVAINEA